MTEPVVDSRSMRGRARRAVEARDLGVLLATAEEAVAYAQDAEFADTIAYIYRQIEASGDESALDWFATRLIAEETNVSEVYIREIRRRDAAVKEAVGVRQFLDASQASLALLQRAARKLPPLERRKRRIALRTASLLYFLGADDRVAWLATELMRNGAGRGAAEEELADVADILRSTVGTNAYEIISELTAGFPLNMRIAGAFANLLMKFRGPSDRIVEILETAIRKTPTAMAPLRWLAVHLVERGMWDRAEQVTVEVATQDSRPDHRLHAATALLRAGKPEQAEQYLASLGPRIAAGRLGALADSLKDLVSIVNRDYRHGDGIDVDLVQVRLRASLAVLERDLTLRNDLAPNDLYEAAAALHQAAFRPFSHFADKTEQFAHRWTECHGTFDVYVYKAIFVAVLEHAALLTDRALSPEVLGRRIEPRFLIRSLAALHADTFKILGRAREARRTLDWLMLLGFDGTFFGWLVEGCDLRDGDLDAVRARGTHDEQTDLHRMMTFDAWCTAENLVPTMLVGEGEVPSTFEFVRGDGIVRQGEYAMPAFQLCVAGGVGVVLRDSELVFGPGRTLLAPHAWHCRRRYPAPSPIVVSQERGATRLKRPSAVRRLEQPVIVLANNDCQREPNYYHWTILILARIHHLLETGYLAGRNLLLPAEMTSWMHETLKLIGVQDDMIVTYRREDSVAAADALVVSPIESVSRSVLRSLRQKMWLAAGLQEATMPARGGSLLFLVRRNRFKRMLMPIDEICDAAERAGYELVAPEDYSVTEQVRMFGTARGVAGPAGAAFTNMLFCRVGTKVMPVMKEESTYPTYTDLAIALDLPLRYCLGRTDERYLAYGENLVVAPYRVDVDILERELAWAAA